MSWRHPKTQVVSYDLTEVLGRMENKLDGIDAKLDTKADRAEVQAIEGRLTKLELAAAGDEAKKDDRQDRMLWRHWALPFILTLIIGLVQVIYYLPHL